MLQYLTEILLSNSIFIGSPSIETLELDRDNRTLTCTSTGGPPATVTWRKNSASLNDSLYQQNQKVLNTITATYENILFSHNIEDLVGSFTCHVSNARGSDSMSVASNGR